MGGQRWKLMHFTLTPSDKAWHIWYFWTSSERDRRMFYSKSVMWSNVKKDQLEVNNYFFCNIFYNSSDMVRHIWYFGTSSKWGRGTFQTKWSCDPMYGKVNKRSKTTCFATFSTTTSSDMVRHIWYFGQVVNGIGRTMWAPECFHQS